MGALDQQSGGYVLEFAPKTILCLVDLSPATINVLQWTALFAEKFGAEVQILHVIWPPVPREVSQAEGEQLLGDYEERRVELGRSIRAQAEGVLGKHIRYDVAVGVGHPVKAVLDFMGQMSPALIVLGSHGHDGMARSLLGSVAENVVRESVFPTLVVKGAEPVPGGRALKSLLCPVDLTNLATQSLEVSVALAGAFGAEVDVLRVLPENTTNADGELDMLRQWVGEVVRKGPSVSETVHMGETAEQIIVFARQRAADLVVVATERRKFLEFTVMGRTVERVVRHGPCSVLLLRLESLSN
jgi:nucleotide-binding universal stress UspA family protein